MDFSPEVLRQQAQRRVEQELQDTTGIIGAYLRGSLTYGSPLLGGAGDIDLVFIHAAQPQKTREIDPLTPDIHFDLAHHDQNRYREPSVLRLDPWLGPTLHDAIPVHDPRHFIDYTQSGVRSNFSSPENILRRCSPGLETAREYWFQHQLNPPPADLQEISRLLIATQKAVNALAHLSGPPLPTRRLGFDLYQRAETSGAPDIYLSFMRLLGAENIDPADIQSWLPGWEETLQNMQPTGRPQGPLPQQTSYYKAAILALIESERPLSALWPFLYTGTTAAVNQPAHHPLLETWQEIWQAAGWWGEDYTQALELFDALLDDIKHTLSSWAEEKGAPLP